MACADADMDIQAAEEPGGADHREAPKIWRYQASEVIPEEQRVLHRLLKKQPATLGSLQIMSGVLSMGLGIIFAVEQQLQYSLITLFRVSHMSGLLFFFAGIISLILLKYPQLLQVSLVVNCGCIVVAIIAICLTSVDLAYGGPLERGMFLQLELLELCVLVFAAVLSAAFCFHFFKEKYSKSP